MIHFSQLLILIIAISTSSLSAQTFTGSYRLLRHGDQIIDSLAIVEWPTIIPDPAITDISNYSFLNETDRVGDRFVIQLFNTYDPTNRSFVGIYFSPDQNHIDQAKLYRQGAGVRQLKVPLAQPGYYCAIILYHNKKYLRYYYYDGVGVYQHAADLQLLATH